ncbi:MAG: DUF2786 domain-containing protein [Thiolinea sp.]
MSNERILEKIQKCMALSASSNENEAASALKQAQKLMEKHGLTSSDVLMAQVNECSTKRVTRNSDRLPEWQADLALMIGKAFDCRVITLWRPGGKVIQYIGCGTDPEIATYSLEVLNRQLIARRAEYMRSLPNWMTRRQKTLSANSYAEGWVLSAAEKAGNVFDRKLPEEKAKAIEAFLQTNGGDDLPEQKTTSSGNDRSSAMAGFQAGADANIWQGVGGAEEQRRLGVQR